MQPPGKSSASIEQLRSQNDELRHRLGEAEEALRAIRAGEVDAVLVGAEHEQVLTLEVPNEPYRLLVEQITQAAATLTEEGSFIYCNRRFLDLLGRPLQTLVGQPLLRFVSPDSRQEIAALLRDGRAAEAQGEIGLERADGRVVRRYLAVSALHEGALGSCLVVTDQTEQRHYDELRRTQEELRATSERLELAQRVGKIGTFEWDISTGTMRSSATQEELYGLPPGGFGGRAERWRQAMHDEDRPRAEADMMSSIAEKTDFETEFRVVRPDQETRWIAAKGKVFYNERGEPERMVGVNIDVTERKRIEEALMEAGRRKDEFLATLAHELRNPLAPIRNAVEIIKSTGQPHPDLTMSQEVIDRQVQVMARLLEDLFDVSRISRNQLELRKTRIELRAVMEAALETSHPLIEAGRHTLDVIWPEEPIPMEADPMRLAQVLSNLLNNAAKYTEEGGHIRLAGRREGNDAVVSVTDDGMGIGPQMLPTIFDIFTQSKGAVGRSQGGLGIGLSLVKALVELHGGSIVAKSEGAGKGSEFTVHLPMLMEGVSFDPTTRTASRGRGGGPRRILVVDDNPDNATTLARLLKLSGHQTRVAYDGLEAIEAARSFQPQMVLLDIGLPRLSGLEACHRIRQEPWGRSIVMVALSGWGQEEDRRKSREAGFDVHLVKPVDAGALVQLLESVPAGD